MPKSGKFKNRLQVGIDDELAVRLQAEAVRRGLPVANFVRNILAQSLNETAAEAAATEGRAVLIQALQQAIKPAENRLADMISKTAIAAATAMYLNTQALADMGKRDAGQTYETARKKAAGYLKNKDGDQNG